MTYLFTARGEARLAALLQRSPMLAFDFDGTLAGLTPYPDRARLSATTRRLLARLAERHPVVVISGRARSDVASRFDGIPLAGISGNHGLEPWGETKATERLVGDWRRRLEEALGHLPGVLIQDKRWSLTVDYRWAPDLEETEHHVKQAVRDLPKVRLLGGRHADYNLAPAGGINKGTALRRHLRHLKRRAALYVGDDRTDEDVFSLDLPGLMSVRVGRKQGSNAEFYTKDQGETVQLLRALVALSNAGSRPRRRLKR
jgi:trehalose 6-phosphate phosphatase